MTTTEWFECLDGIWHWNVWWYFKLKMQMILVCIPGYDRECRIFLAYLFKSKMKLFYHIRLQPLVSILRSPHYVVQVLVCAMLEALDSHRDWILDNSLSYYMSVVQYSSCTIPPRTLSAPRALSVIIPSLPAYGVSWCHKKLSISGEFFELRERIISLQVLCSAQKENIRYHNSAWWGGEPLWKIQQRGGGRDESGRGDPLLYQIDFLREERDCGVWRESLYPWHLRGKMQPIEKSCGNQEQMRDLRGAL